MRFATIRQPDGSKRAARIEPDHHVLLDADDVGDDLRRGPGTVAELARVVGQPTDLAPVVVSPGKVLCAGLNYRAHILEMGRPIPQRPTIFTKFADVLTGPSDDIRVASDTGGDADADSVDWEGELVAVVGAPLYRADRAAAVAATGEFCGDALGGDGHQRDGSDGNGGAEAHDEGRGNAGPEKALRQREDQHQDGAGARPDSYREHR